MLSVYVYFGAWRGRRGRATPSVAVRSAVCKDELGAILLIQTDSVMLRARIIPVLSPHVGGSGGDGAMPWPTYP